MLFTAANTSLLSLNSSRRKILSFSFLANIASAMASALYIVIGNPVFHQIVFGFFLLLSMIIAYINLKELEKKKINISKGLKPAYILKRTAAFFVGGFILWNIDNHFCEQLIWLRSFTVFPFNGIFQFHLWWHVFTAIGAANGITGFLFIRLLQNDILCYVEDKYGFLPTLMFKKSQKSE